jgi:hypothetical protein
MVSDILPSFSEATVPAMTSVFSGVDPHPTFFTLQISPDDAMPHIYSLEDRISEFFETQSSVTRRQCDDMALSISGSPINRAPIQGAFSYTVTAGALQSKIVQFRTQTSLLDMDTLTVARDVHPDFVPATTFHGTLGEGEASPLSVYVMERISGTTHIEARFYDESTTKAKLEGESRRMTTVKDFARYIV